MGRAWAVMERVDAPDYDEPDKNYMTRWRVVSVPWFGLYVHRLDKPDPRPTLHDHPWAFLSLVLRGGYTEDVGIRPQGCDDCPVTGRWARSWRQGSFHRMRKADAHAITALRRSPTWTLLLVGRRHQPEPSWGYWDDQGWTPFDEHPHAAEFVAAEAARRRIGPDAGTRRSPERQRAPRFVAVLRRIAARRGYR
jgi:hypothetical protein